MTSFTGKFPLFLFAVILAGCAARQAPPARAALDDRVLPGMTAQGTVQLPNQWSLKPAGRHSPIGDLPLNMALSPDGRFLAITHSGYGPNEVIVLALEERRETIVSRIQLNNLWYGLAFNADGSRLYAGGGKDDIIYEIPFDGGYLGKPRNLDFYVKDQKIFPAGLAVSRDGRMLYSANMLDNSAGVIDLAAAEPAMTTIALPADCFPYACVLNPDEATLYVSLWGAARVAEIDLAARTVRRFIDTDDHPNEMILTRDGARLLVSNANENSVSVIDTASGRVVETLHSALYPHAPEGSTPNALALSPDEEFLLIANADNNNLAVFEFERGARSRSLGFIPVGWYPTSVRVHPESRAIYVANAKGQSSKANVLGPQPGVEGMTTTEYIGRLFTGTLAAIAWPNAERLVAYTRDAFACSPYLEGSAVTSQPDGPNPIPRAVGEPSPIKYCVYIVKENRTYDQVFGDIAKGNGDPRLCLFPERITPNHHALAEEFVLLDNFYVESEVSADGHEWSMGAYATDFVEKHWPSEYGHGGRYGVGYPAEGTFAIARPSAGYIWDRCAEAGVTYRSYGEFINNGATPQDPGSTNIESLQGHFDPWFRSYDLKYKDVDRAARFIEELRGFEERGDLPKFIVLRLPNDHTAGSRRDHPTPEAMVADNDLALGQIVEVLSRSRFWPEMAIFVVEDDAQNGPDHVDAHRTVALVASPWARRGIVDSSFYSTASMLRTMELILGLQPMSQFDAAARPMYASFTMDADTTPYKARPNNIPLDTMNVAGAWGQEESMAMNLDKEDAADDLRFNEIIWRNVRGADSPMPAPVRAAFVFPHEEGDDEDD